MNKTLEGKNVMLGKSLFSEKSKASNSLYVFPKRNKIFVQEKKDTFREQESIEPNKKLNVNIDL